MLFASHLAKYSSVIAVGILAVTALRYVFEKTLLGPLASLF